MLNVKAKDMKTEMKYTEGPWIVSSTDFNSNYIGAGLSVNQPNGMGWCIATIEDIDKATNEANAKLIAAAPSMIDMLVRISNIEDHAFTLKGFDVKRLKAEVNEVINKATK